MGGYRDRLIKDLDGWIARGLVPATSRDAILDSVGEVRRPEAANALGYVGAILMGLAVIAFVGANWNVIPRIGRYGVITLLFAASAAGGAWALVSGRKMLSNLLLLFAALVFAADIGLSGQIFDLTGDPQTALYGAALGALALALAGRSSGAAAAAMVFVTFGDFAPGLWGQPFGMVIGAALATVLAFLWRSPVLAHAAGVGLLFAGTEVIWRFCGPEPVVVTPLKDHLWPWCLIAAGLFAAGGLAARLKGGDPGRILYGWLLLDALVFLMAAGGEAHDQWKVIHRVAIVLASIGVVAIGRRQKSGALQVVGWTGFWLSAAVIGLDGALDGQNGFVLRLADRALSIAGASAMIALGRLDLKNGSRGLALQIIGWAAFWLGVMGLGADGVMAGEHALALKLGSRLLAIGGAAAMIVFGRIDHNRWSTALGVLFLAAAISATMSDLGLSLGAAAGVFFLVAIGALGLALMLRKGAPK